MLATKTKSTTNSLFAFLQSQEELCQQYIAKQKSKSELGFNVFTLASDTYYRENYHSYILKAFLDPEEKHGEGTMFLKRFIDMINQCRPDLSVQHSDFQFPEVDREWKEIDVLIKDSNSRKAIIIENKINQAVDQHRQLPRYYNEMVKAGYQIVAIVYLPLSYKTPDTSDWTKDEITNIQQLLCIIPSFSYDTNCINYYSHWIVPSAEQASVADNAFILKHYTELVKYLNQNSMDIETLSKFHKETILQNNKLDLAIAIKDMVNELPLFLAKQVENKYASHCSPFKKVWVYEQNCATVFDCFKYNKQNFILEVYCSLDGYSVHFYESQETGFDIKVNLGDQVKALNSFGHKDNRADFLVIEIDLKDEEGLYGLIDGILGELNNLDGVV